jgi:hypothetical protein
MLALELMPLFEEQGRRSHAAAVAEANRRRAAQRAADGEDAEIMDLAEKVRGGGMAIGRAHVVTWFFSAGREKSDARGVVWGGYPPIFSGVVCRPTMRPSTGR